MGAAAALAAFAASPSAELQASVLLGAIDGLLLQYFIDSHALPAPDDLAEALVEITQRMVSA